MIGLSSDDAMKGCVVLLVLTAVLGTVIALALYFGPELPAREALLQVPLNAEDGFFLGGSKHPHSYPLSRASLRG